MKQPNLLFVMCDQLRADAIAALGNSTVHSPNLDRLAQRGVAFTNAYSSCPVCTPARYIIRTGREPHTTGIFQNGPFEIPEGLPAGMEERCGPYLARTLADAGYRTFGIGKFHTSPWNEEIGYEVQLHTEELFENPYQRSHDAYARFLAERYPAFEYLEQLHGERTDMYYIPQMSPLPAELTVESWVADRAIEQLRVEDERPYFGFVSFIGPHPPCAPPIPYNRMYNPDQMSNPVRGEREIDLMDEQIAWMNYAVWAEDINDSLARKIKSRYYGELTYIDQCLGRILDEVEARGDGDNTLICFFSDHGDHLGDHHAWQKESFFEASCRIPFLLSWPAQLSQDGEVRRELVGLTDLFSIATHAAGVGDVRDGIDVLGVLADRAEPREHLFGYYGVPGTRQFKVMVRSGEWKYIFMANGGREQLFHVGDDPNELEQLLGRHPKVASRLRRVAYNEIAAHTGMRQALDGDDLKVLEFEARPLIRIMQFEESKGIRDFGM
ncbi:sulfatase family protein [Paenibacillus koleovorans]|uniref:sulfatase family protein n=1 Tax=Paenibacillus koleovorans TaxID=121608 RepID=UPI0013E3DF71|nr:sulfatase-like hydrolase/transferase [Paenibacillus koleovorans]